MSILRFLLLYLFDKKQVIFYNIFITFFCKTSEKCEICEIYKMGKMLDL